jgi:methylthioribose-1-phosphate isomerase
METSEESKSLETKVKCIHWENKELTFLDQTQLPLKVIFEKQETIEQVWDSIKKLKVRGAPAIGIASAYGLLLGIKPHLHKPPQAFQSQIQASSTYLQTSRPTAVNLQYAQTRLLALSKANPTLPNASLYALLESEAEAIEAEDQLICKAIGEHGKSLIKENTGILIHCNPGSMATSILGTATAPMYYAKQEGVKFTVYVDETRPLLQGARITAWELMESGIDVVLICEGMAASFMKRGDVQMAIVGCDRVAANGDTANKIGTLGVAVMCRYFGIPFYVACPYSTFDFGIQDGADIVIEERGEEEVTHFGERRTAPYGVKVRNLAFDVTPNELITAIITEKGIIYPPFKENIKKLYS